MSRVTLELLREVCPKTKATVLAKYVERLITKGDKS